MDDRYLGVVSMTRWKDVVVPFKRLCTDAYDGFAPQYVGRSLSVSDIEPVL